MEVILTTEPNWETILQVLQPPPQPFSSCFWYPERLMPQIPNMTKGGDTSTVIAWGHQRFNCHKDDAADWWWCWQMFWDVLETNGWCRNDQLIFRVWIQPPHNRRLCLGPTNSDDDDDEEEEEEEDDDDDDDGYAKEEVRQTWKWLLSSLAPFLNLHFLLYYFVALRVQKMFFSHGDLCKGSPWKKTHTRYL